jgi:restriction endonuclease Mrr
VINLPKLPELVECTLHVMGGAKTSMHNKEIDEAVGRYMNLSAEQLSQIRSGKRTEFAYRMAWARQRLKQEKKVENEGKGFWKVINQNS